MSTNQNRRKALHHELMNVYDLFDSKVHYVVPRYQRGYAWTNEQVGILLEDLDEAFRSAPNEEYLLGQIIVCPSEEPDKTLEARYQQWDVIDGQQRCTTLYLMLLAMYLKFKNIDSETGLHSREISELHVLATHGLNADTEWPKIKPASNGSLILEALVNNLKLPDVEGPTAANLVSAWGQINEFLDGVIERGYFEDFLEYFQRQVVLIRLELDEAKHALRVFSKVNNRGLTLDDSDLIKNYLFQKVSKTEEFDKLAEYWDSSANTLYAARLKKTQTMDFLLKLKIGIQTGKSVPSSRIFDAWSEELTSEELVKEFARKLPGDAQTVKDISVNDVKQSDGYSDWNYFTGVRKVVQHYEVLLGASHLTVGPYIVMNRLVQDRMVLAVLSKTEKDFERLVHPWARAVSKLDSNPTHDEIFAAAKSSEIFLGLDELFETAFLKVQSLRYTTQSHQETLRYLLARASKLVQDRVDSNSRELKGYMETTSTKKNSKMGFDLDHIFPKSASQFQLHFKKTTDWDGLDDEARITRENKIIHSLGNLVLLHPQDNREQSDALPWEKVKLENFATSELYLNRLVAQDTQAGLTEKNVQKISELGAGQSPQLESWSEDSVDTRARSLWSLIRQDMMRSFGIV